MFRRALIPRLEQRPHTLAEIAFAEGLKPREVEEELRHLFRSVRRAGGEVRVEPARCRKCGFVFDADTLGRPSKCPSCRGTWIEEARVGLKAGPEGTGAADADAGSPVRRERWNAGRVRPAERRVDGVEDDPGEVDPDATR